MKEARQGSQSQRGRLKPEAVVGATTGEGAMSPGCRRLQELESQGDETPLEPEKEPGLPTP